MVKTNKQKQKQHDQKKRAPRDQMLNGYVIKSLSLTLFQWNSAGRRCLKLVELQGFADKAVIYCSFWKHANSEVQTPTTLTLAVLLRNCSLLQQVQKVMVCDWWISISFVCFCISGFVACDRIYDWRRGKTQLGRRLLNFRVLVFLKSAVTDFIAFEEHIPDKADNYLAKPLRSLSVSCWRRWTVFNSSHLHEENRSRYTNSKHIFSTEDE